MEVVVISFPPFDSESQRRKMPMATKVNDCAEED